MPEPAIVAEELTYRYGDLLAVDHISFTVERGEILGFLGPNGAGKSTTVKMLTGQLRPASGRALLLGIDVARYPKRVQARIGVCFEQPNLYEELSGVDNLRLFANLFNARDVDINALLRRVGLDGRGGDLVGRYSKGMKQRLMIARALVNRPDILFLDEPTEGLDPTSAEAIRRVILEEQQRGATIFLTTHDMYEADRLCNRVAFINSGKIVALDTPHNLKQQYGKRMVRAEVVGPDGALLTREIVLDRPETPAEIADLLAHQQVVTLHSEEATLEDIFIRLTGRGLA
ncbi:ABC transporter ATP-binding protein [Chloroflexus sp.]|uniref:ABC transporter ATP-binding protein n=1 Tax=Chloroflexus sp. TaxID=1904827 RepID=UPI00298EF7F4|nr:ABC transporter ATP-binding protein [Chloroflexus sp.]MCS6888633.1 ABC transporter ATP-binding protein [Chloroflexus sp.]MDW8405410.1 ABC transporter ATP-binding protein [Chloroflexus sp.]